MTRLDHEAPGMVESWQDASEPVVMVHASRLAYFISTALEAHERVVDEDDGRSFEELMR